ncbi:MAG: GvpL/GvpF family gas vesicle protein [Polyangia bacterium]
MPDLAESQALAATTGLYLFCISACEPSLIHGEGLAQAPLAAVTHDGLVAVTCEVALAEWTGPGAEQQLGDIAWLGPRALQHEAVIESVMPHGPVLPLRFGSLFSSAAALHAWLGAAAPRIREFLTGSAAACEEWAIKGWLHAEQATAARLAADPRFQALPAAPGARYLREQKLRQEAERSVRAWARGVGADLASGLQELGVAARPLRVLGNQGGSQGSKQAGSRPEEAVFHFALWVPRARLAELAQRLERVQAELAAQGVTLDLTGPWPPYSFCPQLDDGAAHG